MNKIHAVLACLLLGWSMTSCYKDLGNYDYRDINELSVDSISAFYTIDQLDTLKIDPTFAGTQYADTSLFDYVWEIAGDTVSTRPYLRYRVTNVPGDKYCRFIVTDKATGVKEYTYFNTSVVNATAVDGILLLGDYDGHAELSFKRLDKEGYFQPNIFYGLNGEYLGTAPQGLSQLFSYEASDETDLYGLCVRTDNEVKKVSYKSFLQDSVNPTYTGSYFTSIITPGVYPDFGSLMDIDLFESKIEDWTMGSSVNKTSNQYFIDNGKYFMVSQNSVYGGSKGQSYLREPESGGKLSPFFMYVSEKENPQNQVIIPGVIYSISLGYLLSDYIILFDETNHKFVYGSKFGQTAFKEIEEFADADFSSFVPVWGTPNRNVNNPFVIMSDGSNFRAIVLQAPQDANDVVTFNITSDLTIPEGQMNEYTNFYCYCKDEYFYFTTGNSLYCVNIQAMIDGSWNANKICDLTEFGYENQATINCFDFTRSGKYIALGISTDGKQKGETSSTLNADVLLLAIDKTSNSVSLYQKYEKVGGTPTDIIFKYLSHFREGKDENGTFRDWL